MADIRMVPRIKTADAIYIRQRYIDEDDGTTKQALIRCDDMIEAKQLLPLVNEAEAAGKKYVKTSITLLAKSPAMKYGRLSEDYKNITVAQLVPLALDFYLKKGDIRPKTYTIKLGCFKNYILPFIGDRLIRTIDTVVIQDYFDDLLTREASQGNHISPAGLITPRTVYEVRKVLSKAFKYAVSHLRAIPSNPITSDIIMTKDIPKKRDQWKKDEYIKALNLRIESQEKVYDSMITGCTIRTCEALGLLWDCVHLPDNISDSELGYIEIKCELLTVDKIALSKSPIKPYIIFPSNSSAKSVTCIFETNKTTDTTRTVYLPPAITSALIEHKKHQEYIKELFGDSYKEYNLVFANENRYPGHPLTDAYIRKHFYKFVEDNNLRKVTPYSLRGTGSSQKLRIKDVSIKAVQDDMGGDGARVMMKHYATAEDEDKRKLATEMNKLLFSQTTSNETSSDREDKTK